MNRDEKGAPGSKPDLLKLWMGEPEDAGPPPSSGTHQFLMALLAVAGVAAFVVLAKYAVDVLAIVLGFVVVGLVLHILASRLAQSDLLSPRWLAIIVFAVALLAYAFVPAGNLASLTGYVPKPVAAFFEWSASRGWAQRALSVQPESAPASSGSPTAPAPLQPAAATEGSAPADAISDRGSQAPSNAPVSVTASSPTSVTGQPVVFTARLAEGTDRTQVRFYDGARLLGTGTVRAEGTLRIVSLTVTTLQPGVHEIAAEMAGPQGLGTRRSEPVRHTVR